ncbi:hypothetical protein IIA15_10375 [candidate division TA06 bacterium]|nr:hypothetical protein [candidate division TA06 bacterium]
MGALVAMGCGIFAIQLLLRAVQRKRLYDFSLYLVGLGIVTFLFFGKMP